MQSNEVLEYLRDALGLSTNKVVHLINHDGGEVTRAQVRRYLRPPQHYDSLLLPPQELVDLLDGLILDRRGPPDKKRVRKPLGRSGLSNNEILKKLRIALDLREEGMLAVFEAGGDPRTALELGAMFRRPRNSHFRKCSDRSLRAFMRGLAALRPEAEELGEE